MSIELYRIDDRLIHGQVVVGWGQPLSLRFIVLVDDEVSSSDWEQELYRMGVPPEMDVFFHSVHDAVDALAGYNNDSRAGVLLVGDVDSMARLVAASGGSVRHINIGGIHHAPGRTQRLRYVFLSSAEEKALREIERSGVEVTARDVPGAEEVPLEDLLSPLPS